MPAHYVPEVGHRVRVVLEGEVNYLLISDAFDMGDRGAQNRIFPDASHVVSIERLPDPEPEWQEGDVVSGPNGGAFIRHADRWTGASGRRYDHSDISRPLTLLARNGKHWPQS